MSLRLVYVLSFCLCGLQFVQGTSGDGTNATSDQSLQHHVANVVSKATHNASSTNTSEKNPSTNSTSGNDTNAKSDQSLQHHIADVVSKAAHNASSTNTSEMNPSTNSTPGNNISAEGVHHTSENVTAGGVEAHNGSSSVNTSGKNPVATNGTSGNDTSVGGGHIDAASSIANSMIHHLSSSNSSVNNSVITTDAPKIVSATSPTAPHTSSSIEVAPPAMTISSNASVDGKNIPNTDSGVNKSPSSMSNNSPKDSIISPSGSSTKLDNTIVAPSVASSPVEATTSHNTTVAVSACPTINSSSAPLTAATNNRGFNGSSFVGGIVLGVVLVVLGIYAVKYYKMRSRRNVYRSFAYHDEPEALLSL